MGESPRKIIPSPPQDHAAEEVAGEDGSESARWGSGVTIDSSGNQRSYNSFCCGNADCRLDDSSGWTNEKHNGYLDHLEASFVEHLHQSIVLNSLRTQWRSWGHFPTFEQPEDSRDSIDQFVALCNGCWQKIHFSEKPTFLDRESLRTTDKNHGSSTRNSWIHRFGISDKNPCRGPATGESYFNGQETNWVQSSAFPCAPPTNISMAFDYEPCSRNLVGSLAEASGQNFADDDNENPIVL